MAVNVDGKRPRIALTMGDLSGVGPELAAKVVAEGDNRAKADIYVLASAAEITAAARTAGVDIPMAEEPGTDAVCAAGSELADEPVAQGEVSVQGGRRALADLVSRV